jgi:hypothetical protein
MLSGKVLNPVKKSDTPSLQLAKYLDVNRLEENKNSLDLKSNGLSLLIFHLAHCLIFNETKHQKRLSNFTIIEQIH